MDLSDKTILITRAAEQSSELRTKLERFGAAVIECPTIRITDPDDWTPVDAAIKRLDTYQWLLFTSTNAVDRFVKRLSFPASGCRVPVAAVGAATAARLRESGLVPALVPSDFRAEGLLAAFPSDLNAIHILFPRAETARELLPAELRRRGAIVDIVFVYRTVGAGVDLLRDCIGGRAIDCAVFTSPSTIQYLAENLNVPLKEFFRESAIAAIGPVTANAAREFGLNVSIMPERATTEDLVASIVTHFG